MSDVTAVRKTLAWETVCPGVLLARDSCNVYALVGPEGVVVVDAGSGAWLDAVDALPAAPVAVLCTHFLRDHSAGAVKAAAAGIPVWVPENEEEIFAEPELHHLQSEAFRTSPGYWHHYAPIEAVPVAGVLRDYDTVELAGLELEVVPLPGATIGQIGLAVRMAGVGDVVLCGETIHSAGRVPRLAPLQQVLLDLDGLYMVYGSIRDLRRRSIVALLPSLGDPILTQPDAALDELRDNIRAVAAKRMTAAGIPMSYYLGLFDGPELAKISDHVYQSDGAVSTKTTFVLSESGGVLCIDYAQAMHGLNFIFWNDRAVHRSLLHSLEALEELTGRPGIDVCLATHYHDDHVGNHAALRRRFGTELWACETFADILERPQDYPFPSPSPEPTPVDRRLALEEEFSWAEYRFKMGPRVDGGHTRYQSVFSFEADGLLYAAVGDQFMSRLLWMPSPDHSWENDEFCETYGYRFGQRLGGYRESAEWLLSLRPDVILTGHQIPIRTSELVFQRLQEFVDGFEQMHRTMMPVSDDDVHFDIDSAGAVLRPYRVTLPAPGPARFTATVRNPLPHAATLQVRMVGPEGLAGERVELHADAHAEVEVELSLDVPGPWRRRAVALELTADGRPFGQVGEALVTVGQDRW